MKMPNYALLNSFLHELNETLTVQCSSFKSSLLKETPIFFNDASVVKLSSGKVIQLSGAYTVVFETVPASATQSVKVFTVTIYDPVIWTNHPAGEINYDPTKFEEPTPFEYELACGILQEFFPARFFDVLREPPPDEKKD
jgi:hypothetical protein